MIISYFTWQNKKCQLQLLVSCYWVNSEKGRGVTWVFMGWYRWICLQTMYAVRQWRGDERWTRKTRKWELGRLEVTATLKNLFCVLLIYIYLLFVFVCSYRKFLMCVVCVKIDSNTSMFEGGCFLHNPIICLWYNIMRYWIGKYWI